MNTIETHPWFIYPFDSNVTKLIIGSFPPNKMVLPPGDEVYYGGKKFLIEQNPDIRFDFYYGSGQNYFWELFFNSLDNNVEWTNLIELKEWLHKHEWGVIDIVLRTTRKTNSPNDGDLIPVEWNIEGIENLLKTNNIKSIFFTSKWVKKHFEKKISENLQKEITKFLLISPSPNGVRRFPNEVYSELSKREDETNTEFRTRYYNHILKV